MPDDEVWTDPLHRLNGEEEPRPLVLTYDAPIDESGVAIMYAKKYKANGFTILPLKTGTRDPQDGIKWEQAVKNEPSVFLRNPGTRNYGLLPPPGCFIWDEDKDAPAKLLALSEELGFLPTSLVHASPHGRHLVFRWPEGVDRPAKSNLFGIVTRWPYGERGQGFVTGPGSVVGGVEYLVALDEPIAELPPEWVIAALTWSPPRKERPAGSGEPLAEPRRPVAAGQRHDFLRDKAAWLARTGVRGDALFPAIWSIYEKTCEPYGPGYDAKAEVLRAIGDVSQFPIDESGGSSEPRDSASESGVSPATPDSEPDLSRIVGIADYRASQPSIIPWAVKDLVYYGGVTLLSGPPKAGKSTLLAQMQSCRESGALLFGSLRVETGPSLLVTEEGGLPVVYKTGGLRSLDVLDRRAAAGLTFAAVLRLIEAWGDDKPRAMVFIDTLSVWAGVVDENSASEMTRVLGAVELMAQTSGLAVVLAHHTRKAGGTDGEGIRGSGATFAVVDISAEFSRVATGSDQRLLDVTGRVLLPQRYRLDFERVGHSYVLEDTAVIHDTWLESVPTSGSGLSLEELRDLWGQDPRRRVDELLSADRLSRDLVTEGRAKKYRYLRVD